jgi:hypothetical protein
VKINCPHCQCAYDLEPVKMPSPKYNATHESWGWKFECAACDYQWWLKLVNEDSRMARRGGTYDGPIDARFYDNRYQNVRTGASSKQNNSNDFSDTEEIKNLPIVVPKRNKERIERLVPPPLPRHGVDAYFNRRRQESSFLFWVSILVLSIILAGIVYTYRDAFYQKWKNVQQQYSLQMSAMSLPLIIKKVHWDKTAMPDGSIKIAVVGEVLNQNSVVSRLRPLHMSAWGACDPADKKSPRCLMGGSLYDFTKPTILPEEHLSFQTSWVLPKGSNVTGVDVTLQ